MSATDRNFEDFHVGDGVRFTRRFSAKDFAAFSSLSGDTNPLHVSASYASASRFGAPIVPMHLAALPLSAIAGTMLPGHRSLYVSASIRALRPVLYDTDITYSARVLQMEPGSRTLRIGVIAFRAPEVLLEGDLNVQVRHDAPKGEWDAEAPAVVNAFRNRRVLVTGAGGHIGRAVALHLARSGRHLLLQHRSEPKELTPLAERCRSEGVEVALVRADLERQEDLGKLAKAAATSAVSAVVHSASPPVSATPSSLFAVNYGALSVLIDACLPEMLGRQHGRVILVGSSALQYARAGWEGYAAAKAAATSLVSGINRRFAAYDVRGVTLAPGFVETPFSASYRDAGVVGLGTAEVAERIVASLDDEYGDADYVWLEPGFERSGRFGFHSGGHLQAPADDQQDARAQPRAGSQSAPALDSLVRQFLKIDPAYSIDDAGLDLTPGWDSLRHIELMLHLESSLGLQFTSADIEKTKRFSDLRLLVDAKRAQL